MDFWQTLAVALLGGTVGGIIGIFLNNYLQAKHGKTQRQQILYGKLRALQEGVPDSAFYSTLAHLHFEYYNRWKDLSFGPGREVALDYLKLWHSYNAESEIARSKKYGEFFETLGLICALFKKDKAIIECAKKCFDIPPITVDYPRLIKTLDDLDVWKDKTEKETRQTIQDEIYKPISKLVSLIHVRIVREKKKPTLKKTMRKL